MNIIKTCACRRTFTAVEWVKLKKLGVCGVIRKNRNQVYALELRDCDGCGSTISIKVVLRSPTLSLSAVKSIIKGRMQRLGIGRAKVFEEERSSQSLNKLQSHI